MANLEIERMLRLGAFMKLSSILLLFPTLLVVCITSTFSETPSIQVDVSRYLEKNVISPESVFTVQLNCSMVENITGVIIMERLPIGFKFVNSTSRPPRTAIKFNETVNEVNWLFISLQGMKDVMINYTVEVTVEVEEGTYVFKGDWMAVGYEGRASGLCPVTEILVEKAEKPSVVPVVLVCVVPIVLLIVAVAITVFFILTRRDVRVF
jgi:hypothetical protein